MARVLDAERIMNKVKQRFEKLKNLSPEKLIQLNDAEKDIIHEIEQNIKFINIDGVTRQRFMYLMAGAMVVHDERAGWYFYNAIMSLVVIDEITEILKQRYGKNWDEVLDRLYKYGTIIDRTKLYLDHIEEKTLKDNDIKDPVFVKLLETMTKIPLINYELNHIFIVITHHTTLGKNTVPSQALTMMEREYKKTPYGEDRKRPDMITREQIGA